MPSLDTPVCSTQTKTFADKLNALGDKVEAYTISLDLPFAMKRFCTDNQIKNLTSLSDTHNHSFGEHYGVLIQGLPIPLLARSIFVVDPSNTIKYVEIVPEIATEPNYDRGACGHHCRRRCRARSLASSWAAATDRLRLTPGSLDELITIEANPNSPRGAARSWCFCAMTWESSCQSSGLIQILRYWTALP